MAYTLTKLDLAALNKADSLSVSLRDGVSRVCATKDPTDAQKARDPFATHIDYVIDAPVACPRVPHGEAPSRAFAYMRFYRGQDTTISSVVAMLRVGDELSFDFFPDMHTNQYMENLGLHGDVLRLVIVRGKRRMFFEVDHSICPDNTARMCQGVRNPYKAVA